MESHWIMRTQRGDFAKISNDFGISKVTARILVNRGLETDEEIGEFLARGYSVKNSDKMKDLHKTAEILNNKIKEDKKIWVVGDYDVDGVCATYILYDYFRKKTDNIGYVIPHRVHDGYGINIEIIKRAKHEGVDTLITCDNGIAAFEQVNYAKEEGLTVLITDHHDIPIVKPLPLADSVVNPKRSDCEYPFKGICGACVAYHLIVYYEGLYGKEREKIEEEYLPFVSLATICDIMELKKENRRLVASGLSAIKNTENIGLRAILEETELNNKEISVYHCGFIIGPMINAAGRLESANKSLELFLTKDREEAKKKARELKELNMERKDKTEAAITEAIEIVEREGYKDDKVIVIYLKDCHESIAGIVAGRVKERFYRPTLIFTRGEEGFKGSGRSIDAYNMFEEISKCSKFFTNFGGHKMAAGFSLIGKNDEESIVNLEMLRKEMNKNANLTAEELKPKIYFDMELPLDYITEDLVRELDSLAPFGNGNQRPSFARRNLRVYSSQILGKKQNVLKLKLQEDDSNTLFEGIWFGDAKKLSRELDENEMIDIIYEPSINEFMGRKSIQFSILEYRYKNNPT